jgi:hypothetical protein
MAAGSLDIRPAMACREGSSAAYPEPGATGRVLAKLKGGVSMKHVANMGSINAFDNKILSAHQGCILRIEEQQGRESEETFPDMVS